MFKEVKYTTTNKYNSHTDTVIKYINLECGFDIETTSTYVNGDKFSFMYAWGFGVQDDSNIIYGRTWEEFLEFLEKLSKEWNLSSNKRLVCYVHNLGYEFQFMRKYFEWTEVFSNDERKPMKAFCSLGIEFRDSYILSGFSLSHTAKNLSNHTIEKLTGELDYKKIRHSKTELTEMEWKYLKNDVLIILYYINEQLEIYGDITKIPTTNTGRVREYVKRKCFYTEGKSKYKSSKGKFNNYREIIKNLTLKPDEYEKLKYCFMGGFTHANSYYTGKTLKNVYSVDFTSSYPSVMISEKFPMGKGFQPTKEEIEKNGYNYYLKKFCCMIGVTFKDLKNKFSHESYISESKCRIVGEKNIDNGRVYSAEQLTTIITDVDLWIMEKVYKYSEMIIHDLTCYPKNYLPKPIVESVLELYQDKTVLKGIEGKEVEYMMSKGMLNSIYGMTVTDIVQDNIEYSEDKWVSSKLDIKDEVDTYNDKTNRFLFYPWGVWVTAYARRNLWLGILTMKKDYIYSDTDSLKFLNYEKYKTFLNDYNNNVEMKQKATLNYYNLDTNLLYPKTKKGDVKLCGVWDFEGYYTRFKTLGAKRYLIEENDNLFLTVAGLSKSNGIEYMKEVCNNDNTKVFDLFDDDLVIPSNRTGKSTHTYIDSEKEFLITDYTGKEMIVNSKSAIHLEETEYSLNISDLYIRFYKLMQEGYLYKGVMKNV